jgi:hypothetical protein
MYVSTLICNIRVDDDDDHLFFNHYTTRTNEILFTVFIDELFETREKSQKRKNVSLFLVLSDGQYLLMS